MPQHWSVHLCFQVLTWAYYILFQDRNAMQITVHWTFVCNLVKWEFHISCAILIKYVRIRYSEQENMPLTIPRAFRSVQKCNVSKKIWKSTMKYIRIEVKCWCQAEKLNHLCIVLWQQHQITPPAADNIHGPSSFSLQLEADLKISNYSL